MPLSLFSKQKIKTFLLSLGISLISLAASAQKRNFGQFSADFVSGYKALHLPGLELSYVSGLQHIQSAESVQKQLDFFNQIKSRLALYKESGLNSLQKTDYELIRYE